MDIWSEVNSSNCYTVSVQIIEMYALLHAVGSAFIVVCAGYR